MSLRSKSIKFLYKNIFRPLAFSVDAEVIHEIMTRAGEAWENYPALLSLFFLQDFPKLKKNVLGIDFPNPIGLAAGFDYDGHLAKVLRHVGFGFNTVGTVTAQPYVGNPKPRLLRLPKSKSILVNKGFKSEGALKVAERLDKKDFDNQIVGISVGSTNTSGIDTLDKAIEDYVFTFKIFKDKDYIKYFELNISCPNTFLNESFTNFLNFERLVQALSALNLKQPIFVKMPNEIVWEGADQIISVALKYNIKGFIFSNLVKNRNNPNFDPREIEKVRNLKGNFSGRPTFHNSNNLIEAARKKYGTKIAIIGCGGVFTPEDALEKLKKGADLVQLITGLIFEGPQLINDICEQL